jgi:hypothetical protein
MCPRWAVFASAIYLLACGCGPSPSMLKDGTYIGYEPMANISPEEDPDAFWYHRSVLRVAGHAVTIEQFPMYLSRGEVISSASDGGFPVYEGTVERVGGRTLVRLRKISCDYCGIPVDDPLPSRIEREYIVRFIADGSFEFDRVVYSTKPNPKLEHAATIRTQGQ